MDYNIFESQNNEQKFGKLKKNIKKTKRYYDKIVSSAT